jgi:hypothetical protein
VRDKLPTHNPAEQPAVLRSKKSMAGFLVFYGYFSKLYNINRTIWDPAVQAFGKDEPLGRKASDVAIALAHTLAVFAVANVAGEAISGRGPEDDESTGEWVLRKMLASPGSLIPFFGTAWEEGVNQVVTGGHKPYSMRSSPSAAAIERLGKALLKVANEDKAPDDRFWALLEALGVVFNVPLSNQVTRTGRYATGGTWLDENPLQVGSGIFYGERRGQPLNPLTAVGGKP